MFPVSCSPDSVKKWRSFIVSSIEWPTADSRFLRIVMAMSVLKSTQASYQAFNQLPAIACLATQGFIPWQICNTMKTLVQPALPWALIYYSGFMQISSFTQPQWPIHLLSLSTFPIAKQFLRGEWKLYLLFTEMAHGDIILKCFLLKKFFFYFTLRITCCAEIGWWWVLIISFFPFQFHSSIENTRLLSPALLFLPDTKSLICWVKNSVSIKLSSSIRPSPNI